MIRHLVPSLIRGLYVITQEEADLGRTHLDICYAALEGGARLLQLREKHRPPEELRRIAREMVSLCRSYGATFLVNDYVELAVECGADGLHFGFCPERLAQYRSQLGNMAILGISVDNLEEALAAEAAGADYASLGPIFRTQTKRDLPPPCGTARIQHVKAKLTIPLVVIGGITEQNIYHVAESGADSAAVITAVSRASDVATTVRNLICKFNEGKNAGHLPA